MESRHSTHPCHNLSLPGKKLFWCRHCMTIFENPIDRWRHSRECKNIATTPEGRRIKDKDGTTLQMYVGINEILIGEEGKLSANGRNITQSAGPGVSAGTDLHCFICKKVFGTLEEMRRHVKNPCNKYRQELDAMPKLARRPFKRRKPNYNENGAQNSTTDSSVTLQNTKQDAESGSQVISVQNVTVVQRKGELHLQGNTDVLGIISQVIAEEEPDFRLDNTTTYHVVTVEATTDKLLSHETEVPIPTDVANDEAAGKAPTIVPKAVVNGIEINESCLMVSVSQDGIKEKMKKQIQCKKVNAEEIEKVTKPKTVKKNKNDVNCIIKDDNDSDKVLNPKKRRKIKVDKMPDVKEATVIGDIEIGELTRKIKKKEVDLQMNGIENADEGAGKVKPLKKRKKKKFDVKQGHEKKGKPAKKHMLPKESDDELTLAELKKLKKSKKTGNNSEEHSKTKDKKLDSEATNKNEDNVSKVKRPRGRPRKHPVIVKTDIEHAETETKLDKSDDTDLKNKNIVQMFPGKVSEDTPMEIHVTVETEDVSGEPMTNINEKHEVSKIEKPIGLLSERELDHGNENTSVTTESVNEQNTLEEKSGTEEGSCVEPLKQTKPISDVQSQENSSETLQTVPSESDIMALLRSGAQVIANGEEIIIISVQNVDEDGTEEDGSTWPEIEEEEIAGNISDLIDDDNPPPPIDIESVFPGENDTSQVNNPSDALFNANAESEIISKDNLPGDHKSEDNQAKIFLSEKRVTRSSGRKLRGKKPEMRNKNFKKSLQKKNTDSNHKSYSAHTNPPQNRDGIDETKGCKENTASNDLKKYSKVKKVCDLITKCENGHCDQLNMSPPKVTTCDKESKKLTSKKPKLPKTPKCKICGQIFTSFPLLLRHNRFPCRVKHTRNLCQKVLRPKRGSILKELPMLAKKRRISTKRAPKKSRSKSESKTLEKSYRTRKSAKNKENSAHLKNDVNSADSKYFSEIKYLGLNEKEQFFMQLGMICKGWKPEAVERTRKVSEAERYALLSTDGLPSSTDEQLVEDGPYDTMDLPPPVLELAFVSYLGDRKQVIDGDEEPPILELEPGVSEQFDSRMPFLHPQSFERHTDSVEEEDTLFTSLKAQRNDELSEKDDIENNTSNVQMPSSPYRQKKSISKMSAPKHHSRPTLITEEYRKKHLTARHFSDAINIHDQVVHHSVREKVFSTLNANVQSIGQSDDRQLTLNPNDETQQSLQTSPKETMLGERALEKLYKMINISPTKSYIVTEQSSEKTLKQNTDSKEFSANQFSINEDPIVSMSADKEIGLIDSERRESSVTQRKDILSVSEPTVFENVAHPIAVQSKDAVVENVLPCSVKHRKDQGVHASEQTSEIDTTEKVIIARTKVFLPESSRDSIPSLSTSYSRENRMNLFDSFSALCRKSVSEENFHTTLIDGVFCNFRSTAAQVSPIEFLEQEFSLSSALDSGKDKNQQIVASNQLKTAETNNCMSGNTEAKTSGGVLESLAMSFGIFTGEFSENSAKTCEMSDIEKNEKQMEEININDDVCKMPKKISSNITKTIATEQCEKSESASTNSEETSNLSMNRPDMSDTELKYLQQCSLNEVIVSTKTVGEDQLSGLPGADHLSQSLNDFSKDDLVQTQHDISDNCALQTRLKLPISYKEHVIEESILSNVTVPIVEITKNVSDNICPSSSSDMTNIEISENGRTESEIDQSATSQQPYNELVWTNLGENIQHVSREIFPSEQSDDFEVTSKSIDSSKLNGSPYALTAVWSADDGSQEVTRTELIESLPGKHTDVMFYEPYLNVMEEVQCSVPTASAKSVEDVSATVNTQKEIECNVMSKKAAIRNSSIQCSSNSSADLIQEGSASINLENQVQETKARHTAKESFDNALVSSKSEVLEKIICLSRSQSTQGEEQLTSVAIHSSDTSLQLSHESNVQAVDTVAVTQEHADKALNSDSVTGKHDCAKVGQRLRTTEDFAVPRASESSHLRLVDALYVAENSKKVDGVSAASVQLGKCESRCTTDEQHIVIEQTGVHVDLIRSAENTMHGELDQESKHALNGKEIDSDSKETSDCLQSDKCEFNTNGQQINVVNTVYEAVVQTPGTNVESNIHGDSEISNRVCNHNEDDTNESNNPVDKTDVYSNWELLEPPIDENCETFGYVPETTTEKIESVCTELVPSTTNVKLCHDDKAALVCDVGGNYQTPTDENCGL